MYLSLERKKGTYETKTSQTENQLFNSIKHKTLFVTKAVKIKLKNIV